MRAIATLAVVAALTLGAVRAQDPPLLSRSQLRKSLASAIMPADHARLAGYYREAAKSYMQQAADEEQIAARWKKQYENWTKTPNPYRSAINLASYYRQRANDAILHARQQAAQAASGVGPAH
jgi:hypothetical protein